MKLLNKAPDIDMDVDNLTLSDVPILFSSVIQSSAPDKDPAKELVFIDGMFDAAVVASEKANITFPLYLLRAPKPGQGGTEPLKQVGVVKAQRKIYLKTMERILLATIVIGTRVDWDYIVKRNLLQFTVRQEGGIISGFFLIVAQR